MSLQEVESTSVNVTRHSDCLNIPLTSWQTTEPKGIELQPSQQYYTNFEINMTIVR